MLTYHLLLTPFNIKFHRNGQFRLQKVKFKTFKNPSCYLTYYQGNTKWVLKLASDYHLVEKGQKMMPKKSKNSNLLAIHVIMKTEDLWICMKDNLMTLSSTIQIWIMCQQQWWSRTLSNLWLPQWKQLIELSDDLVLTYSKRQKPLLLGRFTAIGSIDLIS